MADVKSTTIVTRAQARLCILNDADDASRDDLVVAAADGASERLERWTGRVFKARALTERLSGNDLPTLGLRRFPIRSLTSLTIDDVAIAVSGVRLDADLGMLIFTDGRVFSRGHSNVLVTYEAGYADADLPADAVDFALALAKLLYDERKTGAYIGSSINIGGHAIALRSQLPKSMQDTLSKLVDTRFA